MLLVELFLKNPFKRGKDLKNDFQKYANGYIKIFFCLQFIRNTEHKTAVRGCKIIQPV